jgi:hypothetical protein
VEGVTADLMRSLNEEFLWFNCMPDSRKEDKLTGHVARMEENSNAHSLWWGTLKEREHLEEFDVLEMNNIKMDIKGKE